MLGSHGNADIPRQPEELCNWLESLPLEGKHPEWLIQSVAMLCENIDQVTTKYQANGMLSCFCADVDNNFCIEVDCSWMRYDLGKNLPRNFIAMGDAVMRLNPIYGCAN